ncbi:MULTISPECIES: hypothetical protein [unclassified Streptomyces]|uniref:DUF6197 family protein n=1 Tax=unclassified Streptomyces TaxID=2593676 RepID=UPI0008057C2F|nr:hypothetical protein [Streptomyces sp. OspMP-M45]SBU95969.1 hypothetical protein YUMDRAFT_01640 [Streptomyces sp. OspMP-M45]
MIQKLTDPANVPGGDWRPVLVALPAPVRPSTVAATFRAAARVLAANGLYQGDYVPDARDREMCVPHFLRPMSVVAALKCAVTGDHRRDSLLANEAIGVLAMWLGEPPVWGDIFSLEAHVEDWGDVEGRTTESACAVLYAAADASEQVAA